MAKRCDNCRNEISDDESDQDSRRSKTQPGEHSTAGEGEHRLDKGQQTVTYGLKTRERKLERELEPGLRGEHDRAQREQPSPADIWPCDEYQNPHDECPHRYPGVGSSDRV